MIDNIMFGESEQLIEDDNSLKSLYERMMQGFDGRGIAMSFELNEDGYYPILYAPGYKDMGVGDIVAQSK